MCSVKGQLSVTICGNLNERVNQNYLHVAVTVAVEPEQPVGTVYERLGSLSQVTDEDPVVSSMNLYSKDDPTGIVT
jgi:hypothetical protein